MGEPAAFKTNVVSIEVERINADHKTEIARYRDAANEMRQTLREMSDATELLRTQNRSLSAQLADAKGQAPELTSSRESAYLQYIETLKDSSGVSVLQAKVRNLRNALINQRDVLETDAARITRFQAFVMRLIGVKLTWTTEAPVDWINNALRDNPVEDR